MHAQAPAILSHLTDHRGAPLGDRHRGDTLAELFAEWQAIQCPGKSALVAAACSAIAADLEERMVAAGVHSAADAAAAIDWHRAAFADGSYGWGYDAETGTSGALWDSLQAWLAGRGAAS